jgi:hypothetical protein
MTMIPSSSLLKWKFCHSPPFCVTGYGGRIYYVVHRFWSMLRAVIHLGVHNHPIVDGKCRESIKETRRLIAHLMQKSLWFPSMLTRPSSWITCLMIIVMAQCSS